MKYKREQMKTLKLPQNKTLGLLCHEVMHAITYGTSLEMTETQVQVVANNLYQLGFGEYLWKKSGGKYDSKLRRNNKES